MLSNITALHKGVHPVVLFWRLFYYVYYILLICVYITFDRHVWQSSVNTWANISVLDLIIDLRVCVQAKEIAQIQLR